jgi:hypothetical protein
VYGKIIIHQTQRSGFRDPAPDLRRQYSNYPALGFTAAQITAIQNDAAYFAWVFLCQSIEQGDGVAWTAYKRQMRTGSGSGTPPAPSALPGAPTATKWTYRGIYMVDDAPVGDWSAPASIMVGT